MRRKKSGRAFELAVLAAIFLLASVAESAQANWLVLHNGATVEPEVTLKAKAHTEFVLLVKEETNLEILCAVLKSSATSPVTLLASRTIAHGKVELSSCKTWQNGSVKTGCKPKEPIVAGGLALLILHKPKPELSAENYVLLEPDPGLETLATIEFSGATCALPEKNKITGEALAECGDLEIGGGGWVHLDCRSHEVTHLIREAPETEALFEHKLKYGATHKQALIDGIAALAIEGPALYVGDAWGGHV